MRASNASQGSRSWARARRCSSPAACSSGWSTTPTARRAATASTSRARSRRAIPSRHSTPPRLAVGGAAAVTGAVLYALGRKKQPFAAAPSLAPGFRRRERDCGGVLAMRQLLVALVAIAAAGCPSFKPASGKLKCSELTPRTAVLTGYNCIAGGTCWASGQNPDLAALARLGANRRSRPAAAGSGRHSRSRPARQRRRVQRGRRLQLRILRVDQVCCDTRPAARDACNACNLPSSLGTCAPVPVAGSPLTGHPACGPDDKTTCNRDGTCDGAGACRKWATGTVRAAPATATRERTWSPAHRPGGRQGRHLQAGRDDHLQGALPLQGHGDVLAVLCTTAAQCSGSNSCASGS